MELIVSHPQLALISVLELPVIVRTLKAILKHQNSVGLVGATKEILSCLKKFGLEDKVDVLSKPSGELLIPAEYHLDPDLINELVHSKKTFNEILGQTNPLFFEKMDGTHYTLKECERKIFANIKRKTQGWVAPHFNKPISFFITRFLLKTNITPNQITWVNMGVALLAFVFLVQPGDIFRWMGAFLMQANSVIDGCDGEVARIKVQTSESGAWLDTIADDFSNNLFYLGIFLGLYHQTGWKLVPFIGYPTFLASLFITFFIYHGLKKTSISANVNDFKPTWSLDNNKKTLYDVFRPLMKRDFFILVMAVTTALDFRAQMFCVASLATWITFTVYLASFMMLIRQKK